MFGEVYRRGVAGARACACFRGSIRRCRRRDSTTSSWCVQSDAPLERLLETAGAVVGAGWQSGKFLYVDTDLKIDLPQARVVLDRERSPTSGSTWPASARSSARCSAART